MRLKKIAALILQAALVNLVLWEATIADGGQPPEASSGNLIRNSSFENQTGDKPEGWDTQTWGGEAVCRHVSAGRTTGKSVMISSQEGADVGWQQTVQVLPFARYRLTGWIRTEEVSTGTGLGALLNLHEIQPLQTKAVVGTTDWTQVELVFDTDLHTHVQINCLFGGWGLATGKAWYDDISLELVSVNVDSPNKPRMYYTDTTYGRPFAKDPDVVNFRGRYLMYYSIDRGQEGIAIGIAESKDLDNWKKVGEILPEAECEKKGLAAPAAIILNDRVHLFYQTYGNRRNDAICHAVSQDGIYFARNKSNPIFRPTGEWNCGRAIDADVIVHGERLVLYCATRDPDMQTQKLVVAAAPLDSDYSRATWTQLCRESILEPELPWEKQCIEAPAVCRRNGRFYMFYAGAYNNEPQQIGCAVSEDGITWSRLSAYPLLCNGGANEWNASESGHPGIFVDNDGKMHLFFQGNNTNGRTWFLSKMMVRWDGKYPHLVRPRDGKVFRVPESFRPKVTIDTTKTAHPISKYIYGQFIEHLGRCIYGGIWAEMLEDRKFYYPVTADYDPWRTITPPDDRWSGAGVPYQILGASPWQIIGPDDAVHTPEVRLPGDGTACGIAQNDLALIRGREYVGRVVISAQPSALPIEVSLVWDKQDNGKDCVIVNKGNPEGHFEKHFFRFKAGGTSENGRLEIVGRGKGTFRVGTVSLMPADNAKGFRADTLRLLRELNAPVYRWPGGNFVSGYDWKDGIGDPDRRPPRKNPAWTGIEHNDVGIDEFMRLCKLLKAEPYIAINTGLGSVESGRQELEYCNGSIDTPMGKWRAQNGRPRPYNVKWWAVGNEMYGSWQLGNVPLEQYVKRHNRFADALRSVDPEVNIVGVGAVGRWSEQMLTHCAAHMEYISEHFYHGQKQDLAEHVAQIPDSVKRIADAHHRYRQRIDALKGKNIRIAMDEWNYWYGPYLYGELGVRYYMKDALGVAAGLHEFFRNADIIFMANYAQTVNVIGCIKTSKTAAEFATTGQVLKLYRNRFGEIPVAISGDIEPLDVVAAWTADRKALTIGIVNPSRAPYDVSIDLREAEPVGAIRKWTIASENEMAYNVPGRKTDVRIAKEQVKNFNGELRVPALSITLYELPVRRTPAG